MAQMQAAQFGQALAAGLVQQDLSKVPKWSNNPKYDHYRAEDWWKRFEFAATHGAWNWLQIQGNFYNAMADNALEWHEQLASNYVINNLNDLKERFLADFAETANSRASIADINIKQGDMSVLIFWGKVNRAVAQQDLSVILPPAPATRELAFPALAARDGANAASGIDALNAADFPTMMRDWNAIREGGMKVVRSSNLRTYFIAGLNPKIQDEVLRQNPDSAVAALEIAKKAEKEFALKQGAEKQLFLHEIGEEKETSTPNEVNAIRGRGRGSHRGSYRGSRGGRGSRGPDKANSTCFYCNKTGHWQRECRKRLAENGTMKAKSVAEAASEVPNTTLAPEPHPLAFNEQDFW